MRHRTILPACLGSALVALAAASSARAAVDLTALSLEELLDQKVVGASKYEQKQADVAAAVTVITRNEIRTFGWRTLADVMSSLPGVSTGYDRQNNYLGVRGFGLPGDFNTRVLVTVNGNRLNDPTYDSATIGRQFPLDLDLVERIEFIPGPGAAVYGQNAMFGVINVVTRTGADLNGIEMAGAAQGLQRLGEWRVSAGTELSDGTRLLVSVSGMHARGQDLYFN
jgi:iron complex outermembrane receptor protein